MWETLEGLQLVEERNMERSEELERKIETLQERLSLLSEASLRINESLDLETVLQGVLDSARTLTDSRYGVITLLDDAGQLQDFLASGLTRNRAGVSGSCRMG